MWLMPREQYRKQSGNGCPKEYGSSKTARNPTMPPETIYEGPTHEATIYLRTTGYVRLGFSDPLGQQRKFGLLLDLVEPLAQLLGQTHRVDRLANDGLAR
jgi:hypothetical protein